MLTKQLSLTVFSSVSVCLLLGFGCTSHADPPLDATPGTVQTLITAAELPPPHATKSHNNGPQVVPFPADASLKVPAGFKVNLFAEHLNNPRNLTVGSDGTVYVVLSGPGEVVALKDTTGTGTANQKTTYATGLTQPFGIALHDKYLYIGNTDSVVRFPFAPGDQTASGAAETVVPNLPANGYHNHWTRDVLFSGDGKTMFVSVGSLENLGIDEERRAAILAFDPDGGNFRVYASGLRNPVGLAIDPSNKQLWTCVNERDTIGDDLPPDYATHVIEGGFYGWPYAYIGPHPDPTYGDKRPDLVAKTITPDVLITAHSAAVSIVFGTSRSFPSSYRGGAFVSLHGSWNRLPRTGYKVIYIPMKDGKPVTGGYVDFLTGFEINEDSVDGRPVGLAFAKDGSLLVVDDGGGKIWRVSVAQ